MVIGQAHEGRLHFHLLFEVFLSDVMQCRSSWYSDWARRLASWGYAVVQYDDPLLRIVPDAIEVRTLARGTPPCHSLIDHPAWRLLSRCAPVAIEPCHSW